MHVNVRSAEIHCAYDFIDRGDRRGYDVKYEERRAAMLDGNDCIKFREMKQFYLRSQFRLNVNSAG